MELKCRKTYLVTGGAGFIGSNFVKYLVSTYGSDIRIVILDALTYAGNIKNISAETALDYVHFVHGSINDAAVVSEIFDRYEPDYVVNFAAESHVDRSITGPRIFVETNVMGTQTLLDCARASWMGAESSTLSGKRFLQVSTDEVYGSLTRDYDSPYPIELDDELKGICADRTDTPLAFGRDFFTEETPLAPRSPYSASKASADMLVLAYGHTFGLPINITRCSNNYGPYQFPEKLIPLMINNVLHGRELPVYGEGLNVRDWLYVDDHCSAIDAVLRKGQAGEVYNIGGLNEKQNIDIVNEIIDQVAEARGTAPRRDLIKHVADRAGHDMRYAINPEKTARELGWYPRTTFVQGIARTIRWYLDNSEWMDEVTSGAYRDYYSSMYANR